MKGRVAKHWGYAQEVHLNIFHADSKQDTKSWWEKELIVLIWNSVYHVWASQNDALHNSSHDTNSTPHINKKIRTAYSTPQHQMDSHDQQLFNKPIGDRLNTTLQSKQHWLATVPIAVTDFTEVYGRLPTQLRLESFFSRQTTPSNDITQSQHSLFCTSLFRKNDPKTTAHDTASLWEEEDLWADPAGDFAPLFER
eukprot:8372828-Ditylum_brightwellii.AAC.1